jgi:hypothetical protein
MAKTENPSEVLPGTIFTLRQVQIMKVAVVVMGIILIAGFAFIVAALVYQSKHLGESTPATVPVSENQQQLGLTLPRGMTISHMALGDNRLAVHLTGPKGNEIRIIDLGTGAVVNSIPVTSE